jgi:hypothetical protein
MLERHNTLITIGAVLSGRQKYIETYPVQRNQEQLLVLLIRLQLHVSKCTRS